MRCQYSSTSHVSSLMTAPMKCSDAFAAECSSLCWSSCAAKAYPCRRVGTFVSGGGRWASVRMWFAMTQLIMCEVHTWRRVQAVVVDGVACDLGNRRREVGGNDLLSESSSMLAGVSTWAGALVGELAPPSCAGCWTSSGFHITTGSLSMMVRSALACGGVGAVGGTSQRSSIRRAWIAASSSGLGLP
jgi:hypothetical protein